jgi:uncharacterized protein YggE
MSKTLALAVALTSLLSLEAGAAEPAAAQRPATIRVEAQATVSVKADRAELVLGVTTDKKTAAAATSENERKMEQVMAVLKKELGAGAEVKTSELSVSPRFGEPKPGQVTSPILGYTVTNTVEARMADLKAVGKLLDLAFAAGANTVERVSFTLKDAEVAQWNALRAASAKARARATAFADGLGLKVGAVLSAAEGVGDEPFPAAANVRFEKSARVGETPLEPGSVDVTATVTVTFALAPR